MSRNQPARPFNPIRILQKFVVSSFVIFTFVIYAVHEHLVNADPAFNVVGTASALVSEPIASIPQVAPTNAPVVLAVPQAAPVAVPTRRPTATAVARATPKPAPTVAPTPKGLYRDGTYTGPVTDAFYGVVQVKTTIQNGRIASSEFVRYPNDRRTSVRINNYAVPHLQTEAVRAQSANVDVISGATLTSNAFVESLQAALNSAKN